MPRCVILHFHATVDVACTGAGMLMDVPVQIVANLEHAAVVERCVAEHTVELWELPPHQYLVEAVVEVRAFDIIVIAKD